jgi:hypothetical protein
VLQWLGVVVMSWGLYWVWGYSGAASALATMHTLMGWSVVCLGWAQVLGGLARGTSGGPIPDNPAGDHYAMTAKRQWFERIHKLLGWIALLLSIVTILLGLWIADAPRWMLAGLLAWWSCLICAFVHLQRRGRCIDTYQAIWGPDPKHPGNQLTPIGWGIARPIINQYNTQETIK